MHFGLINAFNKQRFVFLNIVYQGFRVLVGHLQEVTIRPPKANYSTHGTYIHKIENSERSILLKNIKDH